jgi:asparagine synthase (glutamine-hydrolysing)
MCGIAGYFNIQSGAPDASEQLIRAMTDTLNHRGPDDGDIWLDAKAGIALGNRRLAIIDLSEAGHQPMISSCGHYVIAYNGEIYNAAELRGELEKAGRPFRGYSDTEVIVEGCALWGVEETAKRIIGMFAFALWDTREKRLFVLRDRLGIKPLYWTLANGVLIFGSELKALKAHKAFPTQIDRNSVASYLRHTFIPAPHTIYRNVHKLEAGNILIVDHSGEPRIESYWSLEDVVRAGRANAFSGSENDAADQLDVLLRDAVSRRMVSDVPLGAFLSGGIDSSIVVALMQAQSERPVRTFSIGYAHDDFNEAHDAAAIARHLGTDHTELTATARDALDVIPSLPAIYDEPFADSSQIPTFLVSRLTKEHVTVALSGDGGDELFGGYTRYFSADKYEWPLFDSPCVLRCGAAKAMRLLSPGSWDRLASVVPGKLRPALVGEKLHKLADCLGSDRDSFYRRLISHWNDPGDLVEDAREYTTLAWDESLGERIPDFVARMQYLDTATYLPDDILTKVDRASMAVSLEVRVPLLDHRVAEFAWTLPRHMKVANGVGKQVLRQVLRRYVPDELIKRKKMGFGVPINEWLRGPLKDWAGDLLSPDALNKHGLINPGPVQRKWAEHVSGAKSWPLQLWSVLMLQSWCDAQKH